MSDIGPQANSFRNQFLIAMPGLQDPNFARTVTLICEHNDDGAMGIIINRVLDLPLSSVLVQLEVSEYRPELDDHLVHMGGPVQESNGFVIHQPLGTWEADLAIDSDLGVSASREILRAIARDEGPEKWFLALGYAGWGPGQLEQEIGQNSWLNGPVNRDILFNVPIEERWHAAAEHLGINLTQISGDAGHA